MAKIHDLFIVELAEVIKGYGNDPDNEDPFRLSEFYRFYELPNIAISRENFEKMRPIEPQRKKGKWIHDGSKWKNRWICSECGHIWMFEPATFCDKCGAEMEGAE